MVAGQRVCTISFVLLLMKMMMVVLSLLPSTSSNSLCEESNFGEGPLNLSSSRNRFQPAWEEERVYISHCVRFFTSLHWYRHSSTGLEPYPWGQQERVFYMDDNQTVLIDSVKLEDDGQYVYIASNGTHNINGTFELQVHCREHDPSFATNEERVQTVQLESSKTLRCAVNEPHCPNGQHDVFWNWRLLTSGEESRLLNSSLDSVAVVCNTKDKYYGSMCQVVIHRVHSKLYQVEFVCIISGDTRFQQTVRLVPVETYVKTWLPEVLGTAGAVILLMFTFAAVWWRYGHRLAFWCRSQPDRGDFQADAVILHGEDHHDLVQHTLMPQVRNLGYSILEEAAVPGRLELPEKLQAAESCMSVILTFSARELAEDGQIQFLSKYIFKRKARQTVVFIRCQDNDTDVPEAGESINNRRIQTSAPGGAEQGLDKKVKNVWKDDALQAFKILNLPKGLRRLEPSRELGFREWRDVDKFWYNLRNHLPKLTRSREYFRNRNGGRGHQKTDRTTNIAGFQELLRMEENAEQA